jgi:hypothetical protein
MLMVLRGDRPDLLAASCWRVLVLNGAGAALRLSRTLKSVTVRGNFSTSPRMASTTCSESMRRDLPSFQRDFPSRLSARRVYFLPSPAAAATVTSQ